jgi:hypothetical protein
MNEILTNAIFKYIEQVQLSYARYYDVCVRDHSTNREFADLQIRRFNESFRVDIGQSYAKIIGNGSVHGFVVLKAGQFKEGDVLKAASFKAPTKNFARSNVFDEKSYARVEWTGA